MKESGDLRGIVFALVAYVVVFAFKLGACFVTGVMVLLAEALHTLSAYSSHPSCSLSVRRMRPFKTRV